MRITELFLQGDGGKCWGKISPPPPRIPSQQMCRPSNGILKSPVRSTLLYIRGFYEAGDCTSHTHETKRKRKRKSEGFTVWGGVISRKSFFFFLLSFLLYSPLLPGAGPNLPICLQGQTLPKAPVPQPPATSR